MGILTGLGDFLLSEWLWSMTFAWSYLVVNIIMSWLLLRFIIPMSFLRSCILAFMVNLFSFAVYSLFVIGIFIHLLQWWYVPHEYEVVAGPFLANSYLAMIYTSLHCLFFYIIHRLAYLPKMRLFIVAVLSNICAALISYIYIVVVFKYVL